VLLPLAEFERPGEVEPKGFQLERRSNSAGRTPHPSTDVGLGRRGCVAPFLGPSAYVLLRRLALNAANLRRPSGLAAKAFPPGTASGRCLSAGAAATSRTTGSMVHATDVVDLDGYGQVALEDYAPDVAPSAVGSGLRIREGAAVVGAGIVLWCDT
jgi:hypothetical protein